MWSDRGEVWRVRLTLKMLTLARGTTVIVQAMPAADRGDELDSGLVLKVEGPVL